MPSSPHYHSPTTAFSLLTAALVALLVLGPLTADAKSGTGTRADIQVQRLSDLRADAARAERERIPILIALFASYCEWCERVEQEFLRPMLLSGEYADKVIIRALITDGTDRFTGLDGQSMMPDRFAYQYDAYLTPTLIFIDHRGQELAERMVGLTTPEMYGGYLDQAIEQATAKYRLLNARRNAGQPR